MVSSASPNLLLRGEEVQVRSRLHADCNGPLIPLHLVLVLDASRSMAGVPLADAKAAASQLIHDLKLSAHPKRLVGVVEFNTSARTLCRLTNQASQAIGCVSKIRASGDTAVDAGIAEGVKVLRAGTGPVEEKIQPLQVMVVLSDGRNNQGCAPVQQEAGRAKNRGIVLATVCSGPLCDTACMRSAAYSSRFYFEAAESGMLTRIFRLIAEQILEVNVRRINLFTVLGPDVAYIAGSADPAPKEEPGQDALHQWTAPNQASGHLLWSWSSLPSTGITVTYRVRPVAPGNVTVASAVGGAFEDSFQRAGTFGAASPRLVVLEPRVLPTPMEPVPVEPTPTSRTP